MNGLANHSKFWMLLFSLVVIAWSAAACDNDSNESLPDGSADDLTARESSDGDRELAEDDFVPHQPVICPINHCQSRRIKEGSFCFGFDMPETTEPGEEDETLIPEDHLMRLVNCGTDENNCPIELGETTCEFGCDPEQHICNPTPDRALLSLTISRQETIESITGADFDVTDFTGTLTITIFTEARTPGQPPADGVRPIATATITDVDVSDAGASLTVEAKIEGYQGDTKYLPAGSYFADAILRVNPSGEDNEQDVTAGDLLHHSSIQLTAPETGNCSASLNFDRVFDEATRR